jgi:hypothetical protein
LKGPSEARQRRSLDAAARRAVRLTQRRQRDARIGLSSGHICTNSWAEVAPRGNYLAVHVGRQSPCPVAPTTRGAIHGFSRKSRGRLLKTMAKIDRSAASNALFVTLTYPSSFTAARSQCKGHLHAWGQALVRAFPKSSFIWRLELTKIGTPHFHLIVFGVQYIAHEWVSRTWARIAATGHRWHEAAGTEVRRVKSSKEALGYAAKYAAKLPESEANDTTGRVWGVIGRKYIPICVVQRRLDGRSEARLARAIRNMVGSRRRGAKLEYPPRWVICHGREAERILAWALGGN